MRWFQRNASGSAADQLAIKSVADDMLELASGKRCMVIETSSVNFELKSDAEQDGLLDNYQSFLNSIGFPLQIIIRTRELDVKEYLAHIGRLASAESKPAYKRQLQFYSSFVANLVTDKRILSRRFYMVISFCPPSSMAAADVKAQLRQRLEVVSKGLARLGMTCHVLKTLDLLNLIYGFNDPEQYRSAPLLQQSINQLHQWVTTGEVK